MLASSGSCIKFWNTDDFKLIQELPTNASEAANITWNKDGQFLGSLDTNSSEISLYTVSSTTASCSGVLRIMENINCLEFCNTTNRYMAVGGSRDSVLVWDVKRNTKTKSFVVARAGVTKLSFSVSDSHLAVGTSCGDAFLLSNVNNSVTGPVKVFSEKTKVTDIRYNFATLSMVGVCSESGAVAFLDTHATKVLKEFPQVHTAPVSALAFSPINELLMISVGYDKKFVSYNTNSKSVLMSHKTASPLTSVCFLKCGQRVCLGAMTGEVLVYDLRMLSAPLSVLAACRGGPVTDLRIRPGGGKRPASGARQTARAHTSSAEPEASRHQQKDTFLPKTENKVSIQVKNEEEEERTYSPSLELFSPVKMQTHKEERSAVKGASLLKSFPKTPSRLTKKDASWFDDMGILSPIDKENKSPSSSPLSSSQSPKRHRNAKPTLVEGLLSPLQTSLNSPSKSPLPGKSSGQDSPLTGSPQSTGRGRKHVLQSIADEIFSPVKTDQMPEGLVSTPGSTKSDSTPASAEKQSEAESALSGGASELSLGRPATQSDVDKIKKVIPVLRGEHSEQEQPRAQPLNQLLVEASSKGEASGTELSSDAFNIAFPTEAFEVAFPNQQVDPRDTAHQGGTQDASRDQQEKGFKSVSSGNLSLELVRSCMSEVLEWHEVEVNKRLMNMHWSMIKQFFGLKKEMKELIKESSINEEILLENERLRQEIERLKCIY